VLAKAPQRPARDLSRLSVLQRQMFLGARRGADWLQRGNRPDGRFDYIATPSLRLRAENDPYLRQAGAALALARAARFFEDERAGALATQSVLTLLLATAPEEKDARIRRTTVPSTAVNRLASAGLLVLAVHELPGPAADLLGQADQLCHYILRAQRTDGALVADDVPATQADDMESAALALRGLVQSQHRRPAPWKLDVARKARAYYHPRWQARKGTAGVADLTAAYAEAFLLTRDRAFADAVFEMSDWLCSLQYQQPDPQRPLAVGGFMGWADGKAVRLAPDVGAARHAEALTEACRLTKQTGDAVRHARYRDALERALQFVTTLQYTEANTPHFEQWYRQGLVGAFHNSHQDGNLRLDYTTGAVCALLHFLQHAADLPAVQ
jgi:hypothetical protein